MEICNGTTGAGPNRGYHLVRMVLAVVLLTAAALKCQQLATEPTIGTSLLESRWLLMATVEFELFFGIWLLANIWAKPTWAAALACFGLFTGVSLFKALSGHATCGCFGRVPVNPWYTSTFDLAVVVSLLRWRPSRLSALGPGEGKGAAGPTAFRRALRVAVVLAVWLAVGVPAGFAMGSYEPSLLSEAGTISGDGKVVVLEPWTWIGRKFPLLGYVDVGNELKRGEWTVLLYHFDCPKCQEVIALYVGVHGQHPKGEADTNFALIEVPPYRVFDSVARLPETTCVHGRLRGVTDWFVETPVVIRIHDSIVFEVNRSEYLLNAKRTDVGGRPR